MCRIVIADSPLEFLALGWLPAFRLMQKTSGYGIGISRRQSGRFWDFGVCVRWVFCMASIRR
jgi:hypothetical protein